jgi:hypothetical protein
MSLLRVGIENLIEKEMISPYNLAHLELGGDCCGIFNILDGNGIIRCNECNTTIHDSMKAFFEMPTEEAIILQYPIDVGDGVIMEPNMSYGDTLAANKFRRQGAKWFRSCMKGQG